MVKKNSGFLLVNKPSGPTSHDIIDRLRKITGERTIGHAGTLDPFASGLLLVAVGREATREISRFVKLDKEYAAELRLGAVSDTFDRTGRITPRAAAEKPGIAAIERALEGFLGPLKQLPPIYSAKKVGGRKLYELARRGIEIERPASNIVIHEIGIDAYNWPKLSFDVRCSSGTYIRSLADDIGTKLGCGAYVEELKRTAVGTFRLEQAVDLEKLTEDNWQEYLMNL